MERTHSKSQTGAPRMTTGRSRPIPAGRLLLVLILLGVLVAAWSSELRQILTWEMLLTNRARLQAYTESHYASAVSIFIGLYCALALLSLPGCILLAVTGGFLFGSLLGTLYVNIGATTGAALAFLTARHLLRDWLEVRLGGRFGPLREGFRANAFRYLVTLRLVPAVPFALVNLLSGLTQVPLRTHVAATALGIIPASFVYAYAGRQAGLIMSPGQILIPEILIGLALLALLALAPILYTAMKENRP